MDSDKQLEVQSETLPVVAPLQEKLQFVTDNKMRQLGKLVDGNLNVHAEQISEVRDEGISETRDDPSAETDDVMSYNNVASEHEAILTSPGSSLSMPEAFDSNVSTANNTGSISPPTTRPEEYHSNAVAKGKNGEGTTQTKTVFVLHFADENDQITNDIIYKFASHLVDVGVDVTLDLFHRDEYTGNWNMWYETELSKCKFVLCIITEDFNAYLSGEGPGHIKGNTAYNLMNSNGHVFIPVFLGSEKNLKYIPTCLQGFSSYSIPYSDISKEVTESSKDFKALYSLLTGQNRWKKPECGQKVILPNKDSELTESESKFASLQVNNTPVKALRTHNKMFMQLAMNMVAEWEPVGRTLGIGEPKLYSIKRDNPYSVQEQAVQMFQQWLMKNGSRATLGALATGVYETGPQYRNLLDIIFKHV